MQDKGDNQVEVSCYVKNMQCHCISTKLRMNEHTMKFSAAFWSDPLEIRYVTPS
jgi:hypothetical protein